MQNNQTRIIAEIGCNHGGQIGLATDMARAALEAGADFIKFQMFDSHRLALQRGELADEEALSRYEFHPDTWTHVLRVIPREKRLMTVFDPPSIHRAILLGCDNLKLSHVESRNPN